VATGQEATDGYCREPIAGWRRFAARRADADRHRDRPAHRARERTGIGDRAVKTGQDFAHAGESIWHGITSIF